MIEKVGKIQPKPGTNLGNNSLKNGKDLNKSKKDKEDSFGDIFKKELKRITREDDER